MHRGEVDGFVGGNDFKSKMGNFRKNTRYLNLLVEAEGGHIFFEKKKTLNFYICHFMDIQSKGNKAQKNYFIFRLTELIDMVYGKQSVKYS